MEFSLHKIFEDAFGYSPPEQTITKLDTKPTRMGESTLGQPYYETDVFGREFFLPIKLDGILVSFGVMAMTWKKTIIETPLPERGGSVNELISIDDYQFNIKGILVNEDGNFPEEQVIQLHNMFLKNKSITLRSVISDIVLKGKCEDDAESAEGHQVIIKDFNWVAVSGVEHAKPFEMSLKSDMIFDLEVV